MKENIEPGYMAKIEWEFEIGTEYPHDLTRVVKYSTYLELLSRLQALERTLGDMTLNGKPQMINEGI